VVIPPGREGTFEYVFKTIETLEAMDYPLAADILYFSPKRVYRHAVYNATIELTDKSHWLATSGPNTLVLLFTVSSIVYFIFFAGKPSSSSYSSSSSSSKKAAAVEQGTASSNADEWVGEKYKRQTTPNKRA
jgi:hypothetical protein